VGLERGPLSLVSTTEELIRRKSTCSGLEKRYYGRGDHVTFLCTKVCTTFGDKRRVARSVQYARRLRPRSLVLNNENGNTNYKHKQNTRILFLFFCSNIKSTVCIIGIAFAKQRQAESPIYYTEHETQDLTILLKLLRTSLVRLVIHMTRRH
jgi:hypothetical protein